MPLIKKPLYAFLLAFLFIPHSLLAQPFTDAKALLQANIEKTGGDKWASIQSVIISSTIKISLGEEEMTGSTVQSIKFPTHQRTDFKITTPMGEMNGKTIITPTKAWYENDMMGKQELEGDDKPAVQPIKEESYLLAQTNLLFSLANVTFEGKQMYAVSIQKANETLETRYYDPESFLLYATQASNEDFESVTYYSAYQQIDGLTFSFQEKNHITSAEGQQEQLKTIDKLELNASIEETTFSEDN